MAPNAGKQENQMKSSVKKRTLYVCNDQGM